MPPPVRQPGTPERPRFLSLAAPGGGERRLTVAAGEDLLGGIAAALERDGLRSAAIQLIGGRFARAQYLTCLPCDDGERVIAYGPPTTLEGPVVLLGGSGFLGLDAAGAPILHCHAVMIDAAGRLHGGHLMQEGCIVGRGGIVVHAAAVAAAAFVVAHDEETNLPVFHPADLAAPAALRGRTAA